MLNRTVHYSKTIDHSSYTYAFLKDYLENNQRQMQGGQAGLQLAIPP